MPEVFKTLSELEMAVLFCVGFVVATIVGILACRPYSRRWIHGRRNSNDMIGFALQSFATLYGIFLGLLAVEAYQDFASAKEAVSKKALTIATLYHDMDGFPKELRTQLQGDLHDYTIEALETHWPKNPYSRAPAGSSPHLHLMLDRILAFAPTTKSEEIVHEQAFNQVNTLIEQRRLLLSSEANGIPGPLWTVVGLGALIYMLFMCLLEMELHVHIVLGGTTALFLGAVVFLIAALDNPFRGGVTVDPAPIIAMRDAVVKMKP